MRRLFAFWLALASCFLSFEILDRVYPPPLDIEVSRVVTDHRGDVLRAFPVEDGRWRLAADLSSIDDEFLQQLLLIEDQRFYEHGGVDLRAIVRAARTNLLSGRIVSGASTITMQTARLLEPKTRTFRSKIIEMFRARQIERRLSKQEILELYLTLTPYGGNLEGLRAASHAYFGRSPAELNGEQIALLIALPQSPEARRPDRRPEGAKAGRAAIVHRLADAGVLENQRAWEVENAEIPRSRYLFPQLAFQYAERFPESTVTTIDGRLQAEAQRLLSSETQDLEPEVQAAAMVMRIKDRAILASVGSADRERPGGWLDLTRAERSPGSTLKPFIYTLAFEEGIAGPQTLISDQPSRFGSYRPENFDRLFYGELTAATALQHSLNVPAVMLLDQLGAPRFLGTLDAAGIHARLPAARTKGLAVALGGLGVTAEDLAVLYGALADEGRAKPLAYTPEDVAENDQDTGLRVFDAQASQDVLDILKRAPAPDGRMPATLTSAAPRIAFKTGTSYGFRDGWAVGVGEEHVIVVWLGRADGAPRPGITGRQAALPLLFELFDQVEPEGSSIAPVAIVRSASASIRRSYEPVIAFPPHGATLYPREDCRGFVLAGTSEGAGHWFVDGDMLPQDQHNRVIWRPQQPGFYRLTLVDGEGKQAVSGVRLAAASPCSNLKSSSG